MATRADHIIATYVDFEDRAHGAPGPARESPAAAPFGNPYSQDPAAHRRHVPTDEGIPGGWRRATRSRIGKGVSASRIFAGAFRARETSWCEPSIAAVKKSKCRPRASRRASSSTKPIISTGYSFSTA